MVGLKGKWIKFNAHDIILRLRTLHFCLFFPCKRRDRQHQWRICILFVAYKDCRLVLLRRKVRSEILSISDFDYLTLKKLRIYEEYHNIQNVHYPFHTSKFVYFKLPFTVTPIIPKGKHHKTLCAFFGDFLIFIFKSCSCKRITCEIDIERIV